MAFLSIVNAGVAALSFLNGNTQTAIYFILFAIYFELVRRNGKDTQPLPPQKEGE